MAGNLSGIALNGDHITTPPEVRRLLVEYTTLILAGNDWFAMPGQRCRTGMSRRRPLRQGSVVGPTNHWRLSTSGLTISGGISPSKTARRFFAASAAMLSRVATVADAVWGTTMAFGIVISG